MKTFKAGSTYKTRSPGDANCVITVKVLSRTAKTLKAEVGGEVKSLRVHNADGVEFAKPWGSYSMAPTLRASQVEPTADDLEYSRLHGAAND